MTWSSSSFRRGFVALAGMLVVAAAGVRGRADAPAMSAADAIHAAVLWRMGADADVSVSVLDLTETSNVFREARPDPSASLGKPVRFTLITTTGAVLPATATVHVFVNHAVVCRDIQRGARITAADIEASHDEILEGPMRRLPTSAELVGAEALRPIARGATMLGTFAKLRRSVEPGDHVTVVAMAGAVQVTATFVAADGGNDGDVVRVVNPETKRYLRGRVVQAGMVEVGE